MGIFFYIQSNLTLDILDFTSSIYLDLFVRLKNINTLDENQIKQNDLIVQYDFENV